MSVCAVGFGCVLRGAAVRRIEYVVVAVCHREKVIRVDTCRDFARVVQLQAFRDRAPEVFIDVAVRHLPAPFAVDLDDEPSIARGY
jgi:hypothetical protein